jgi:hypothetical protein
MLDITPVYDPLLSLPSLLIPPLLPLKDGGGGGGGRSAHCPTGAPGGNFPLYQRIAEMVDQQGFQYCQLQFFSLAEAFTEYCSVYTHAADMARQA